MRLVCSLMLLLACGVSHAQSSRATAVEHIAASWSHARFGDLDDAVQAPLVEALVNWAAFDGEWTSTPIDMSAALGLIRCTACRETPPARHALLMIAEQTRVSPATFMDLITAHAIARRCAPRQLGDPFRPNVADEHRALALVLAETRRLLMQSPLHDLPLMFLLHTGVGDRLRARYAAITGADWEAQVTTLFEQTALRDALIGVESNLRAMRRDRARWMGLWW